MTARPAHVPDAFTLITVWRKSHHSDPSGERMEVGVLYDGVTVAMRNSRDPHGPALIFDAETECELIDAAQDSQLDWLLEHSRFEHLEGGRGIIVRGGSAESGPGA